MMIFDRVFSNVLFLMVKYSENSEKSRHFFNLSSAQSRSGKSKLFFQTQHHTFKKIL